MSSLTFACVYVYIGRVFIPYFKERVVKWPAQQITDIMHFVVLCIYSLSFDDNTLSLIMQDFINLFYYK
jgi:hypothetical protein